MADNTQVMLKMLPQEDNTAEVLILKLMSSDPFASDPRNHCIALLDIFTVEDPDVPTFNPQIVVFPFFRKWQMPPLLMTEELMSLVRQLLEVRDRAHTSNSLDISQTDSNARGLCFCTQIISLIGQPYCEVAIP